VGGAGCRKKEDAEGVDRRALIDGRESFEARAYRKAGNDDFFTRNTILLKR